MRATDAGSCLLILTAFDDAVAAVAALTLDQIRTYAERHGCAFRVARPDLAGRTAYWLKIAALREALEDGAAAVAWLDLDIVVQRPEVPPQTMLGPGRDFWVSMQAPPRGVVMWPGFIPHPNVGVIAVRNTPWVRAFLERIWSNSAWLDHVWPEQAALCDLMGYRAALGRGHADAPDPEVMAHVGLLDPVWNSIPGTVVADDPVLNHYAGLTGASRLEAIRHDLETLPWRKELPIPARAAAARMIDRQVLTTRQLIERDRQYRLVEAQLGAVASLKRLASLPFRRLSDISR